MQNENHVRVVLNPVSGGGASRRAWPAVRAVLESSGSSWRLEETRQHGHAEQLARSAVTDGATTVLVVGGDGTINEVVNGLLGPQLAPGQPAGLGEPAGQSDQPELGVPAGQSDQPDPGVQAETSPTFERGRPNQQGAAFEARDLPCPHLGIVPAGEGNDFVKQLDVPCGQPGAAAQLALAGAPRAVDVGLANGRCFVIGVGMGLDGYVALEVAGARRLGGLPTYVLAVLRALRSYRTATARIVVDDANAFERSISMLAVANGPCQGGGFWICPHARIDDGVLDVGTLDAMGPVRVVPLALRVMRGAHVGHPSVSFTTGNCVVVETDTPLPAQMDGEILGTAVTRLEVELLPGALSVLT